MVKRRGTDGPKRPSVYDVASRAGVSIATVSRVLRGSAPVAAATRSAVLAAADELGWRPSRLARAFVAQSHGAVGIVFPDLGGPYYSRVIAGFEATAAERQSAVLILATHGRANADELVADFADRVDGLVVMGSTIHDDAVAALALLRRPVVLLARAPIAHLPTVRARNGATAGRLARHVLDHGPERIAFVGDPALSPDVDERWQTIAKALRSAGHDPERSLVRVDGFDAVNGYKAGLDLFAPAGRVDAVMCANDEVAAGVIRAAVASGRRVPDDVIVTGWDDSPLAAQTHPPLTTVRQPMHELGARAAALLFDLIDGDAPSSVVLPTAVVVRGSCGCPPQRSTSTTSRKGKQP